MPEKKWNQVKELFHEALRHDSGERERFLENACQGNIQLRIEVESLLIALADATSFLEEPLMVESSRRSQWQLAEGQTISHYTVVSPIGIGGMGEVYLARDDKLKRSVALKILPAELANDAGRLRRFQNEAAAVSALNHPNILTIFEFGETDGIHLFASEFVAGETLRKRMSREGSLAVTDAVDIAIQIASALKAAHEAGVIHRDIKPENVMIRDDGYVKVLDFGLAKLLTTATSEAETEDETRSQVFSHPGMIMGTITYMSPEQARGRAIDSRTDLFSFGVVLYEMLAGRVPFRGETKTDVLAAIIQHDPPPPSMLNPDVPPRLDAIVKKCLQKERGDRYASASELYSDLKGSLMSEPAAIAVTEAKTEIIPTVEVPASRRKLWLLAVGGAVLFLLFVALATGYFNRSLGRSGSEAPPIRSLAVLPLKSLDSDENYLGLGIADAVIRRISQTGKLNVRPTSAVRPYLNLETDALSAAKDLNADAVMEGSVQRADNRLRVSVNLLRSSDGSSLWAENFDMQMTDVFAIQDRVAQQVAARLSLRLDPQQTARLSKHTTSDPNAYEFYIKGVYSFDKRGFGAAGKQNIDETIDLFEKAVAEDPNYALAHALLAQAYVWKALFVSPDEQDKWAQLGRNEIKRAEEIDPDLAESHIASAWLFFGGYQGYQIESAAREILRAQEINPSVGHLEMGQFAYHVGLEDVSEREFQRALEIDPTSEFTKSQYAIFYQLVNRWDDYLIVLKKYFPDEPVSAFYYLGKGQLPEAKRAIAAMAVSDPTDPYLADARALEFALEGNAPAAEQQVQQLLKGFSRRRPDYHHATYDIACVYALLGNTGQAMKWLRETGDKGNPSYIMFTRDPFLDRIRQSPDFVDFMADMRTQYERYAGEFGGG